MKAKTEELLYMLLWLSDLVARPTFRNLNDSFESWARRNGHHRQLAELERRKFLESQPRGALDGLYRLTDLGRAHALGGRDPEARWNRPWDHTWRLVVFDIAQAHNALRVRLRRFLREHGFGYLQNSVWVSPDPLGQSVKNLASAGQGVESLITMEARPCSGESAKSIVLGAWDFDGLNQRYERYLQILAGFQATMDGPNRNHETLLQWLRQERLAWINAFSRDPLLPSCLLPPGYLGRKAWKRRSEWLKMAGLIKSRQ